MCGEFFYNSDGRKERGLRFECRRCSACCRYDPGTVSLSENDLLRLMDWSGLGRDAFIEKYCRWVEMPSGNGFPVERLCLREKPGYDCILWDNGCTAYEARPLQCSSFPFWEYLVEDGDLWNSQAAGCPGMNRGKLHSPEEIRGWLEKRKREPFIEKILKK